VLRDGSFVEIIADPQYADRAARVTYWMNIGFKSAFAFIGLVSAWEVLYEIWKLRLTGKPVMTAA
jgi:hypothetical protein